MRMWMVDPLILCRKHLLGEHVECHMLAGSLRRKKSIDGFITKKIIQPSSLKHRHDALAKEMISRGYNHRSEIIEDYELTQDQRIATVDVDMSYYDLFNRCEDCKNRQKILRGR